MKGNKIWQWLGAFLLALLILAHLVAMFLVFWMLWRAGNRHIVAPLADTWVGLGEVPLIIVIFWAALALLVGSGLFYFYRVTKVVWQAFFPKRSVGD
jgi:hypothetical protein